MIFLCCIAPVFSGAASCSYTLRRQFWGMAFGTSSSLAAPGMTKAASHLTVRGIKVETMKIILTVFLTVAVVLAANAQTPAIAAQATYPTGHKQPQLLDAQAGRYALQQVWLNPDSTAAAATIQCRLSVAGHYQLQTKAPTYWTPPLKVSKRKNTRQHLLNEHFRTAHEKMEAASLPVPSGAVWTTKLLFSPLASPPPPLQDETEICFRNPEFWPIFNGCETLADYGEQRNCSTKKTIEYIYQHYKYPASGDACVQGTIVVLCTIETDGSVSNVRTVRGLHPSFDAEAERVVASMPRWTPGRMYDKVVRMEMIFPVRIRLE